MPQDLQDVYIKRQQQPSSASSKPSTVLLPQAHASSMPLNEKRRLIAGDISEEANRSDCKDTDRALLRKMRKEA